MLIFIFFILPLLRITAAKLVHGRPHKLNASWYCNVVGHYYPRDDAWSSMNHVAEAEYAVPPKWANEEPMQQEEQQQDHPIEAIEFRGGMKEPGCYDGWCRSTGDDLIRWKGPSGSENHWIDANGEMHEFAGKQQVVKSHETEAEEL